MSDGTADKNYKCTVVSGGSGDDLAFKDVRSVRIQCGMDDSVVSIVHGGDTAAGKQKKDALHQKVQSKLGAKVAKADHSTCQVAWS